MKDLEGLRPVVGRWGLFALAFGCIVGSGWILVLGDWLAAAAPGGTVLGFIAGSTVMLAVCAAYGELVARIPRAGGDFEFARIVFGARAAFFVGWFLTLGLVAVASFEGIALSWILGVLFPIVRSLPVYSLLGSTVTGSDLLFGLGGVVVLCAVNYRGVRAAARMQTVVTFTFIAIALFVIGSGMTLGSFNHLTALFTPTRSQPWWQGALWVFALAPFLLNGFQSVPQVAEERASQLSFAVMAHTMYMAIVSACVFYCGIVLAATMAGDWRRLPTESLPAAEAFASLLPHRILPSMLLAGAALSVVKTWNGMIIWAARLILAQARVGFMPRVLSAIHPRFGSPARATLAVASANGMGVLIGRGGLIPLLNMTSICVTFTLVLASAAALRLRRRKPMTVSPYIAPGGRPVLVYALVGSLCMATYELIAPWLTGDGGWPLEWLLLTGWAVIGCIGWGVVKTQARRGRGAAA